MATPSAPLAVTTIPVDETVFGVVAAGSVICVYSRDRLEIYPPVCAGTAGP